MNLRGTAKPGQYLTGNINKMTYQLITAYGIAVKNGFEGTEEEWLKSLQMNREEVEDAVYKYMAESSLNKELALICNSVRNAAPRNLLDNSYFRNPVNQRGGGNYSGAGYNIDRWKTAYDGLEVTIENGYLRLQNTVTSGLRGLGQLIEPDKTPPAGTTLTVAYKIRGEEEGETEIVTGVCQMPASGYVDVVTHTSSGSRVRITAANDQGCAQFSVVLRQGTELSLEWVALYEGEYTAETLPAYQPKGYGAELAECQRYFLRMDGTKIASGYSNNASTLVVALPIPTTMRLTTPTLTISGNINILLGGTNYGSLTVVDGSATAIGGVLRFRISRESTTAIPANEPFGSYWTADTQISADL